MKRFVSILCAAVLLASLAGCKDRESSDIPSDSENSSVAVGSTGNSDSEGANISDNSDNSDSEPEKKKPEGEPTFLIGLDGEPVYTSEISQIFTFDSERKERVPTDKLDKETLLEAVCEGFTYGYIPRPAVNFIEDPEPFETDGNWHEYIGAELPESSEFIRINVGDRFGSLTVKAAKAFFNNGFNGFEEFYGNGYIEFDGEIELTGYVDVGEDSALYQGAGGQIWFCPDSASSVKIPSIYTERNFITGTAHHFVGNTRIMYGEAVPFWLGNISDIDSELRAGDENIKVKVTVTDIMLFGAASAVIKDIELI